MTVYGSATKDDRCSIFETLVDKWVPKIVLLSSKVSLTLSTKAKLLRINVHWKEKFSQFKFN